MTERRYSSKSAAELLRLFEQTALSEDETYITGDISEGNKCFRIIVGVRDELNARGEQARRSLLRFLTHENPNVRLRAAKCVYPIAQAEARKCLEDLAAARIPDQSLSAGMTLSRLEEQPDCLD